MSEPQVLSVEQVDELERGATTGKYLSKMSALDLITTVRAKEAKIQQLQNARSYWIEQSGDANKRAFELQTAYNEAVAVIERVVEQSRISGKREGSHRLFGMDDFTTRIEEAEDFLAKHKEATPTNAT